jgi:hypothetical protein
VIRCNQPSKRNKLWIMAVPDIIVYFLIMTLMQRCIVKMQVRIAGNQCPLIKDYAGKIELKKDY